MIGKIFSGIVEVILELLTGLFEAIGDICAGSNSLNQTLENINIKMMGSYAEIEKLKSQNR